MFFHAKEQKLELMMAKSSGNNMYFRIQAARDISRDFLVIRVQTSQKLNAKSVKHFLQTLPQLDSLIGLEIAL